MDRLLITNANGFLGAGLAAALADEFDVLAMGDQVPADGCRVIADAKSDLVQVLRDCSPQWVIHCGWLARSAWDWQAASVSSEPTAELADAAAATGCRLTVLSTDAIFSGPRLFHHEGSPPREGDSSVTEILRLETAALEAGAFVARTHAYGWDRAGIPTGFAQRVWNALKAGEPLPLSVDRHASPIFIDDLAELLVRAYRRDLCGLYHVAGGERTSQYRFAADLALACRLEEDRIEPLTREASASVPCEETSLDCRPARRVLQAPLPLLREGLMRFAARQPGVRRTSRSVSRQAA